MILLSNEQLFERPMVRRQVESNLLVILLSYDVYFAHLLSVNFSYHCNNSLIFFYNNNSLIVSNVSLVMFMAYVSLVINTFM